MPFLEGFRRLYPKVPVIIYGKGLELSTHQDTHLIVLPSTHLERTLKVADQVRQERAFDVDSVNPCLRCLEPCSSYWPRRGVKYLLEDYHFLRIKWVREVADHFGVREAHLDTVFNRQCWLSLKQLLLELKLCYAAYLRETTTFGVEEIAPRCGFWDGHHLSRLFHQKVGMPFWSYPFEHPWQEVWDHFIEIYKEKNDKVKGSPILP